MSPALAGRFFTSEPPLKKTLFFRFQVHNKVKQKMQRFSTSPSAPGASQPPPWSVSPPEWYICYNGWTYTDTSQSPRVHSLGSFFCAIYSRGSDCGQRNVACHFSKQRILPASSHQSLQPPPVVHPERNSRRRKTGCRPQIVKMRIKGIISMNSDS